MLLTPSPHPEGCVTSRSPRVDRMRIKLIQPTNIRHEAGEVVEASPARASFLISCGAAVSAEETKETATKEPKAEAVAEVPEVKKTVRKTAKK